MKRIGMDEEDSVANQLKIRNTHEFTIFDYNVLK